MRSGERAVSEQEAVALLMALPGVVRVAAVRAQGALKHFVVSRVFPGLDPAAFCRVAGLWPFGTVEADVASRSTRADFLVRPEEVGRFLAVLGRDCAGGPKGGG